MTSKDSDGTRSMYTVVSRNQKLIPVPFSPGWARVPRWNASHKSTAHELLGADLQMPGGRPYGYLWYRHFTTGKNIRIGVRWNTNLESIECKYLHDQKAVAGRNPEKVAAALAEADAKARVSALMSLNALIGTQVLSTQMEDGILDAAGLGLQRIGYTFLGIPEAAEEAATADGSNVAGEADMETTDGETLITGLRLGEGAIAVTAWPVTDLDGWTRTGSDLTFQHGHPFGSLAYEHAATGERLRVGVGWDDNEHELAFVPLHATEPRSTDLVDGVDDALRDARGRIGRLVAIHTSIGQMVVTEDSLRQILHASGFDGDVEYVDDDESNR
ncbi:hypothetical protein [Frondihabitans australicus]|uniref:Uncharacterized protein n=1 Tax=Frondihabitans australicus TaxID=386892 RepID=A0A495IKJ5_9MICO|nr:hypothetical protein [Frondihabitans australicus]RKR76309.1 hypothetical protein C8E83_3478 [Frondihabitans australicus]